MDKNLIFVLKIDKYYALYTYNICIYLNYNYIIKIII